jgi:hypothetical protein
MNTPTAPAAAALVTCPKCLGKGRVSFCSPYTGRVTFTGSCFECDGKGKMTEAARDASKYAAALAGLAEYSINIAMLAIRDGEADRAEFYLAGAVENMFIMGRKQAMRVLAYTARGQWYDDHAETAAETRGYITPAEAAKLCDRLCEIGRERKAA